MEEDLRSLAISNGGYLHRADVLAAGGSDALIRTWLGTGTLTRLRVGTFAFSDELRPLAPEQRHVVLARSVLDKFPAGSVALSHHSAAAVRGLALYGADLRVVHLTRLDAGAGRTESGVHHHRLVPGLEVAELEDGRLTLSVPQVVWQVACSTGRRGALVVMDSGLNQGLLLPEHLDDAAGRFRAWVGSRTARLMVPVADAGAETAGESLMRFVCFEHGLPRPTTQHVVHDESRRFVARSDLAWCEYCHLGEFDGMRKYWRDLRPGEDASDAVVREKLREDAARRMGFGMSRATYQDVLPAQSRHTAARIEHDLVQSRRLYARDRRHIV